MITEIDIEDFIAINNALSRAEVLNKRIILDALRDQLHFHEEQADFHKMIINLDWNLADPDVNTSESHSAFIRINNHKTARRHHQKRASVIRKQIILVKRLPSILAL